MTQSPTDRFTVIPGGKSETSIASKVVRDLKRNDMDPDRLAEMRRRAAQETPKSTHAPQPRTVGYSVSTPDKVAAGMALMGGALCALGFYSAAKHSVEHDDQGVIRIHWNNVGIALLLGAFTIGSAYTGLQAFKGNVAR